MFTIEYKHEVLAKIYITLNYIILPAQIIAICSTYLLVKQGTEAPIGKA